MKEKLVFEQLPDPLSRFRCISSNVATVTEGHEIMDPYPYFYDERFEVDIKMQNGDEFKNY